MLTVSRETRQAQSPDIFKQQRPGSDDARQLDRPSEMITLICGIELFAGDGKRRTGHATSK
jgi:hypothetical protein